MRDGTYRFDPIGADDVDELHEHYQEIRDWLLTQDERDVRHHLPNLVETVAEAAKDPETIRFLVGVSFTQNHTPLDYMLERWFAPDDVDFLRRDPMKLPVSRDHHYVRFVHPADSKFDGAALRAALLSALETVLYMLEDEHRDHLGDEDRGASHTRLSDLWQEL